MELNNSEGVEETETTDAGINVEDTKPIEEEDQELVKEEVTTSNVEITGNELKEKEEGEREQMEVEHLGTEKIFELLEREQVEGEEEKAEKQTSLDDEAIVEEEPFMEEIPPDPSAPFNFSDSKEAIKEPFELRPDQLAEVEQLWDIYQNYTPAYTDIDNYITEKELVYMLKSIFLMTFTHEQLLELIDFCVRPSHPQGHITFEQFLKIVTIRQRDFLIEDELRAALQVFDPEKTGLVDRENLKEVLAKQGHKMPQRQLDNLIKEVDLANDGTIGIEDIVGTMCIDLNKEDLIMIMGSLNPNVVEQVPEDNS